MIATQEAVERWVRAGKPDEWTAQATGWSLEAVRRIADRVGRCEHAGCGRPQSGPGRPRRGWVRIGVAAGVTVWCCGWRHAARYAAQQAAAA